MARVSADELAKHEEYAREAAHLYQAGLAASESAVDWAQAKLEARKAVVETLRQTRLLNDIQPALMQSAAHLRVIRRMLAAPISQDQFKFICRSYSKGLENSGRPLSAAAAKDAADVFAEWRDLSLTRWVGRNRAPYRRELAALISGVSPLIAAQLVTTVKRERLAIAQELAVTQLLDGLGWKRQPSLALDQRGQLPARHYAHKTKFATRSGAYEVDIACGLGETFVLAMECKVTNDATNSIKRINDVLNKARAWEQRWGDMVQTGAMLQGVIPPAQIKKLLDAEVSIFWSHRLEEFQEWLSERTDTAK